MGRHCDGGLLIFTFHKKQQKIADVIFVASSTKQTSCEYDLLARASL